MLASVVRVYKYMPVATTTSHSADIDVDLLVENSTRLVNQLNSDETPMDISEYILLAASQQCRMCFS